MTTKINFLILIVGIFALSYLSLQAGIASGPIIKSSPRQLTEKELMDFENPAWQKQDGISVLLNRTPRLYETDPVLHPTDPGMVVKSVHNSDHYYFYLYWKDNTFNSASSYTDLPKLTEYASQSRQYPITTNIGEFPDASAIQIAGSNSSTASIIMGDPNNPVDIFYWKNGVGTQHLTGMGRTVVEINSSISVRVVSRYQKGYWTVIYAIPIRLDKHPIAFAIWDGGIEDRNGQKFYSIWYQMGKE